jgi:hypothetical protein
MNLEKTGLLFFWRPLEVYSQADLQSQDRKCTCNLTLRLVRATVVAVEVNITYSERELVALVLQRAKRMRRVIFFTIFLHITL